MRNFIQLVLILCVSFLTVLRGEDFKEHIKFSFDERDWHLDFQSSTDDSKLMEFTLQGETVDNWSELVTACFIIPPEFVTLEQFYHNFTRSLTQLYNGHPSTIHLIAKDENSLLFEWGVHDQSTVAQHEWFKLIKSSNRWYMLRYTTKKINEVEKVRPIWEKILQEARVSSDELNKSEYLSQAPALETILFIDDDKTFSIFVPEQWKVTKLQNKRNNSIMHIFNTQNEQEVVMGSMLVIKLGESDEKTDRHTMLELFVKEHMTEYPSSKMIRCDVINMPRGEVVEYGIFGPCTITENVVGNIAIFLIPQDGKMWMIIASAPTEFFDTMFIDFKRIISTFCST